jgi:hypothetical protein
MVTLQKPVGEEAAECTTAPLPRPFAGRLVNADFRVLLPGYSIS